MCTANVYSVLSGSVNAENKHAIFHLFDLLQNNPDFCAEE